MEEFKNPTKQLGFLMIYLICKIRVSVVLQPHNKSS